MNKNKENFFKASNQISDVYFKLINHFIATQILIAVALFFYSQKALFLFVIFLVLAVLALTLFYIQYLAETSKILRFLENKCISPIFIYLVKLLFFLPLAYYISYIEIILNSPII